MRTRTIIKREVVVLDADKLWQSIVGDMFTFTALLGSQWIAAKFIPGATWLHGMLAIMLIFGLMGFWRQRTITFRSFKDAIEHLERRRVLEGEKPV